MKNHGRYMLVFGLLGGLFISSGMLLKDYFEWSPTFGWLSGFFMFLTASYFAMKSKKKKNGTNE
mgnify:CR=1 FL=1